MHLNLVGCLLEHRCGATRSLRYLSPGGGREGGMEEEEEEEEGALGGAGGQSVSHLQPISFLPRLPFPPCVEAACAEAPCVEHDRRTDNMTPPCIVQLTQEEVTPPVSALAADWLTPLTLVCSQVFGGSGETEALTGTRNKRYAINPLGQKWTHHNITYRWRHTHTLSLCQLFSVSSSVFLSLLSVSLIPRLSPCLPLSVSLCRVAVCLHVSDSSRPSL